MASGSTIYRVPALSYGTGYDGAAAQRQALAVRAWQNHMLKKLRTDAERLAAAEEFYQDGDLRRASLIYVRLTLSRTPSPASIRARQRLGELATEAREKLRQIDDELQAARDRVSPSQLATAAGPAESVIALFQRYEELERQYQHVPEVAREIREHIGRRRRDTEYAAVLKEPKASVFWNSGQARERDGELCCAYWFYSEGAKLKPAPSAIRAHNRLEEMKRDPQIVKAAEACRELQWCQRAYDRAERLRDLRPTRAKELFAEIISRSPENSTVHLAAKVELAKL